MNRLLIIFVSLFAPAIAAAGANALVVEGLAGEPAYAEEFERQASTIGASLRSLPDSTDVTVLRGDAASREAVLAKLDEFRDTLSQSDRFVLVLIGHGSYDDYQYKFNLPGPDVTGEEIVAALDALPATTQVFINTSSASGAIGEIAAADGRTVVLATRSGVERHATRFGGFFADALTDDAADTDKNERISVSEAFRYAERQVADYYERGGQLATEHPVIDGGRAERFALGRIGVVAPAVDDSSLAELLAERNGLNAEIDELRRARDDMSPDDYRSALLEKMLELAEIEDAIDARREELDDGR